MFAFMKPWDRTTVFADAYGIILDAMRANGVRRILAMGTLSIPDPKDRFSLIRGTSCLIFVCFAKLTILLAVLVWIIWTLVHGAWRNIIAIGEAFDKAPPEIDWTVYRIGMVKDGAEPRQYAFNFAAYTHV